MNPVTIYIDNEPVPVTVRTLTAREILLLAGLDPACHYLMEVKGRAQESYQDRLDAVIHLHEKQRFVTARIDAVCPVS